MRGDTVTLHGERKPSEIKVSEIAKDGGTPVRIAHPHKRHGHHHQQDDVSPADAINAVTEEHFVVLNQPRRKPKHFEILARSATGDLIEFHVGLDGHIRKRKPI